MIREQIFPAAKATANYALRVQEATRIVDTEGRLFIYRSKRTLEQRDLLEPLAIAIQEFAENTVVSDQDRANNKRGSHKFCIAGADRQSKAVSGLDPRYDSTNCFLGARRL